MTAPTGTRAGTMPSQLEEIIQLAEFGKASMGLLHDISSPLAAAALCLQDSGADGSLGVREARRNIENLQRYISMARRDARRLNEMQVFSVNAELENVKAAVRPLAAKWNVGLDFSVHPSLYLRGDPTRFQRIVINLITNAIEACRTTRHSVIKRGRVSAQIYIVGSELSLVVKDNGRGISAQDLPQIFDYCHSTKQSRDMHRHGLGLYMVKRYVEHDFGGNIAVASSQGQGTTFTVNFPLHRRRSRKN